jgi:hypothetical protein
MKAFVFALTREEDNITGVTKELNWSLRKICDIYEEFLKFRKCSKSS